MSGKNVENKVDRASSEKTISLPVSRVKLIMKSSPDVSCINQDALILTTKATVQCVHHISFIISLTVEWLTVMIIQKCKRVLTLIQTELFVQHLASTSYNQGVGKKDGMLSYSDLANAAEEIDTFQFLTDILPKKILARDYLKSLEEMAEEEDDDD